MDETRFWQILSRTRKAARANGNDDDAFDELREQLLQLPAPEILQFRKLMDERLDAAYKIDLWGAGSLINGGCSDDGFHYFRCWVLSRGRKVFERAVEDPDSLADIVEGEGPYESSLDAAPAHAWVEKTGRTDEAFYDELERVSGPPRILDEGEDWDFEDEAEVRRRLPRLAALYLDGEGE